MNPPNPFPSASRIEDLERTCFVIMPFGKKKVGDGEVDFTQLYNELFEPAIAEARTPLARLTAATNGTATSAPKMPAK